MAKLDSKSDSVAEEEVDTVIEVDDDGDHSSFNSDEIVWNNLKFKYVPEPEPEWDVDSYEGREYESDPEYRKFHTDEDDYKEFRRRRCETLASKGFSPDYLLGIYPYAHLDAPAGTNLTTNRERLTDLANLCVKKLNEEKGKSVELDSIVSATVSGGARRKIYITLMAREYHNGPLVEYQAKVMRYCGNYKPPFPILCRRSPKPEI